VQNNITKATVGAGVVVDHEGQYLLVQMNYGSYKGHWILPGGMVEYGETPKEAAARECLEETGVEVEVLKLISVRYRQVEGKDDNIYYVFQGRIKDGAETHLKWPEEELMEARFWGFEELQAEERVRPLTQLYVKMSLTGEGLPQLEPPATRLGRDEVFGSLSTK